MMGMSYKKLLSENERLNQELQQKEMMLQKTLDKLRVMENRLEGFEKRINDFIAAGMDVESTHLH